MCWSWREDRRCCRFQAALHQSSTGQHDCQWVHDCRCTQGQSMGYAPDALHCTKAVITHVTVGWWQMQSSYLKSLTSATVKEILMTGFYSSKGCTNLSNIFSLKKKNKNEQTGNSSQKKKRLERFPVFKCDWKKKSLASPQILTPLKPIVHRDFILWVQR